MPQKNDSHEQINIWAPLNIKEKLQYVARIRSIKENRTIFYTDIIREILLEYISGSFEKEVKDFNKPFVG